MSVHTTTREPGIYFITFTCSNWIPLIELTNSYDLVYNWFDVLKKYGHIINAYVIMPNHLHCLLFYSGGRPTLNTVIGNGKRFMAYEIVNRIKQLNYTKLLADLQKDVSIKDRSRGKLHNIWERAFDAKQCRTEAFTLQKLVYIHNNPCAGKWKLATNIIEYPHSSAAFYISGKACSYCVKDYREFLRLDGDESNYT